MATDRFHVVDYVVFSVTIIISVGIGIFYALRGNKENTTAEYLVGGRTMAFIPVAISLMVSFESSIMILGLPAEAYVYGVQWIWWAAGVMVSQLLSIHIVVPLLHPLKLTSAYEYLEFRFKSRATRLLGTILGILSYCWYMGIVLYGPAVALEAVTSFSLWTSIFVISTVAVIYTSIGGLKAVIWTDVFQALVMFMGIFAILIKGTIEVGGPVEVWNVAERAGRMNFFDFSMDPRVRHTFWNLFVGSIIRGFGLVFNQSTVQRISSTSSLGEAKRMLILVTPSFFISLALATYMGVVIFSYYQTVRCDPMMSGHIDNPNQLVPFFVMDVFESLPGMPGLFLASLFSASLSTLSSGLSSTSALLWADVIQPLVGDISERKATIIAKCSVVAMGLLNSVIAILVSQIGGTLIQIAGSLISAFAGPLTGLFFLGCYFPRSNAKGTIAGGIVSFAFCLWLALGMSFSPAIKDTSMLPPAATDQCQELGQTGNDSLLFNNSSQTGNASLAYTNNSSLLASSASGTSMSFVNLTTTPVNNDDVYGIDLLYTLSYQWISVIGTFATIIIGIIVSFFTGMNKPGEVDPIYLISIIDTIFICLPRRCRRFLSSLGPQFKPAKNKAKKPESSKLRISKTTKLQMLKKTKMEIAGISDGHHAVSVTPADLTRFTSSHGLNNNDTYFDGSTDGIYETSTDANLDAVCGTNFDVDSGTLNFDWKDEGGQVIVVNNKIIYRL